MTNVLPNYEDFVSAPPSFFFSPKKSFVLFKVQTKLFFGTEVKNFAKKHDQGKKPPQKKRK
jgi:hypothetical protein